MERCTRREGLRELLRRGADDGRDALASIFIALADASDGTRAALYAARDGRLELEAATGDEAPRALDDRAALAAALDGQERPTALDALDERVELAALTPLRRAGFERVLGAFEEGALVGLVVAREGAPGGGLLEAGALALAARSERRARLAAESGRRILEAVADVAAGRSIGEQAFVAAQRASAALDHALAAFAVMRHGRALVLALSGREGVDGADPEVRRIERLATATAARSRAIYAVATDERAAAATKRLRAKALSVVEASPDGDLIARAAHAVLEGSGRASLVAVPLLVDGEPRAVLVALGEGELLDDAAVADRLLAYAAGLAAALDRLLELRDIPLVALLELFRPLARWLGGVRHGRGALALVVLGVLAFASWSIRLEQEVEGRCAVVARERAPVRAPRAGSVRSVTARDGAHVEAGEVLATLDVEGAAKPVPVVAPIRGMLAGFDIEERGTDAVSAGERLGSVATLVAPHVEVEVPERDRTLLAPGAEALVKLGDGAPLRARLIDVRSTRSSHGNVHFVAVLELAGDAPAPPLDATGRASILCGRRRIALIAAKKLAPWLEPVLERAGP